MSALVVWEGAFGKAVAHAVRRETDDVLAAEPGASRDGIARADCVVFVSWRSSDVTATALADAAHDAGVPFFPVQLDNRVLVIGPLFGAAGGPCYRCFRARYLTHAPGADRQQLLWKLYADDPGAGVAGFTPSMVRVAAAAVLSAIAAPSADPTVRWFDVLTGDLTGSEIVAVHACPGPHDREAGGERFVTALEALLDERLER
ncbi:MAG: TOMM precursor leader peptide-binding protein [Candidatus Eremiobacteraeota bacterium]|nr:TOMM precursor leader peptide-binding protein [Candidatus Eremiobacteraeota bacterium]